MKIIKAKKTFKVQISGHDFDFKKDYEYVAPDSFVDALQKNPSVDQVINSSDFINEKELTEKIDYTGKRLLITRTGGRGDFHFILRVVKQIKDEYKNVHITFCCSSKYFQSTKMLFQDLVDEFSQIPCNIIDYNKCDYFFTFEGYIESNPVASKINAFELMSMKFFIEIKGDHSLSLKIYPKYLEQANELKYKRWKINTELNKPKVIGIQPKASAIMRTYPYQYTALLIKMFNDIGYQILLLDDKNTIEEIIQKEEFKNLDILFPYDKDINGSFELSAALAKQCDLIIAPDSIFTYIADSFGIPAIILFGPFSSALRAEKLNVFSIEVLNGCYNCCIHQEEPCDYSNDIFSPCLKRIHPKVLFESALKILNKEI